MGKLVVVVMVMVMLLVGVCWGWGEDKAQEIKQGAGEAMQDAEDENENSWFDSAFDNFPE